jgi:hypothetical protein
VKEMNENEILTFMLNSIKQDNHDMAIKAGMSEEQIKQLSDQSQPSLSFMVKNLYNRMSDSGLIVKP